ncbi:MAG: hypothetical protein QM765_09255 [Myxococcales bacterium]
MERRRTLSLVVVACVLAGLSGCDAGGSARSLELSPVASSKSAVSSSDYLPTNFVVWGGNSTSLKVGDRVNFWGHSWKEQVLGGDYDAQARPSSATWSWTPGRQPVVGQWRQSDLPQGLLTIREAAPNYIAGLQVGHISLQH